jgi:hypothetical protein
MPRAKPNERWQISNLPKRRTASKLSTEQRNRLGSINGLPAGALPAIEQIAERFLSLASDPPPSNSEVRARLASLAEKIAALLKEIGETDVYTVTFLSQLSAVIHGNATATIHGNATATRFPNPLRPVESSLTELLKLVQGVYKWQGMRISTATSGPTAVAKEVAGIFRQFNLPFTLEGVSPAIETIALILNMVSPTTFDAARQAVYRAMTNREKKTTPAVT